MIRGHVEWLVHGPDVVGSMHPVTVVYSEATPRSGDGDCQAPLLLPLCG